MADSKISALTDGGGLQGDDALAVARSGSSFKAKGVGVDGWISDTAETWTYVSATSFKVSGVDVTAKYTTGTRIRCKQGGGYKYFVVVSSAFSTDTTVTITGGSDYSLANSAITDNYHSYDANPQGYPTYFNYNPNPTGFSGTPSKACVFSLLGKVCTVQIYISGTSNSTSFGFDLPIAPDGNSFPTAIVGVAMDSGSYQATNATAAITGTSATVGVAKNGTVASGTWTGSGTKRVFATGSYKIP